jgi:hypothetical protein
MGVNIENEKTKGKKIIQKLVILKTNKEKESSAFPA